MVNIVIIDIFIVMVVVVVLNVRAVPFLLVMVSIVITNIMAIVVVVVLLRVLVPVVTAGCSLLGRCGCLSWSSGGGSGGSEARWRARGGQCRRLAAARPVRPQPAVGRTARAAPRAGLW